jgi:FkbM family methyltransferase
MNSLRKALEKKLIQSYFNDYGADNYDESRFGETHHYPEPLPGLYTRILRAIIEITGYKKSRKLDRHKEFISKYEAGLQKFYEKVNKKEQEIIVGLIAYRLLGYKKVKLSRNNKEYWAAIEAGNSLTDKNDTLDPHFMHFILQKCDLRKIGYDIQIYFGGAGVAVEFIMEQYSYKSGDLPFVSVEKGDIVFDLGACWGDTSLYFASKAGENGKVYSFEFIPENIKIFNINISLNPLLLKQIELIQHPVTDISGEKVFFKDDGPGSQIEYSPFDGQTGQTTTISIDDFVKSNNIGRVDFIKMDIEGAESAALKGAIETIRKFKPKLAIAIYHSMEDFVNIPDWIIGLNLGYKIYLGHYTIHAEETVIFARTEG